MEMKQRYVRIHLDGGGIYTQEVDDLSPLLCELKECSVGQKWTLTLVEMTAAEYNALPEFEGH